MAGNDCCRKRPRAWNLSGTCWDGIATAATFSKWKLSPYARRRVGSVLESPMYWSGICSDNVPPKAYEYLALLIP
jgi:hypothetical protein